MTRKSFLMVVLFLFPTFWQALAIAEDAKSDFRKTKWGMTEAAVKATESSAPTKEQAKGSKQIVVYKDTVSGLPCYVVYIFLNDKLVRTKYIATVEHTNKAACLSDFEVLASALREKYGNPKSDDSFWSNDLYKENPDEWGMAVAVGHLSKYATWETDTTKIVLALRGDNFEIDLEIEYASRELAPLEDKADKAEEQRKL